MKHYATTIQDCRTIPCDLVPPGPQGWELELITPWADARGLLIAWSRDERPCPSCFADNCCAPGSQCHQPWPLCTTCRGSGWVPL